jgi:hypothetical protein
VVCLGLQVHAALPPAQAAQRAARVRALLRAHPGQHALSCAVVEPSTIESSTLYFLVWFVQPLQVSVQISPDPHLFASFFAQLYIVALGFTLSDEERGSSCTQPPSQRWEVRVELCACLQCLLAHDQ